MFLYHENQAMNGQNLGSFSSWIFRNGVLGNDSLKMRETILEHESVFRNQLLELHRLYGRQKELMDEIRRVDDRHLVQEKFPLVPQASYDGDTGLSLRTVHRPPCNVNAVTLDLVSKGFPQNPSFTVQRKESTQRHLPCTFAEKNAWLDRSCKGEIFPGKPSALQSQNAEPCRKRKLFGVEIPEANDASGDDRHGVSMSNMKGGNHQGSHCFTSWTFNSLMANSELEGAAGKDGSNEQSCWSLGCSSISSNTFRVPFHKEEGRTQYDENVNSKPAEKLPWFLRKFNEHDDMIKGMKSSYFMNLESLQQCKHSFFKKAEPQDMNLKNVVVPDESAASHAENAPEKHCGLMIAAINASIPERMRTKADKDDNQPTKVLISGSGGKDGQDWNTCTSDLRHQIDLNLSLDEEDSPVVHSLTTMVRIAATEIDLEAPMVDEFDADVSTKEAGICNEEFDRLAAEAIIAFSLHKEQRSVDVDVSDLSEDTSCNDLKWFAELIISEFEKTATPQADKESIPEGMDHFEFMTLKLEDCKGKNYDYQPVVFDNEKGSDTVSTRTRRQSRRGKPRKDFQRDILPGMVTLSRLQVSEDLQSFEELMKAQGKAWQSGLSQRSTARGSRGKKRTVSPDTSPKTKLICSSHAPHQQPIWQLQERSLTGWGKKTRRLPRQRCPNGFVTFPIKC